MRCHIPCLKCGRTLFKIAGVGSIGWRALLPLWSAGKRLLQQEHFDLVYISTAHFPFICWGPSGTGNSECHTFWMFTILSTKRVRATQSGHGPASSTASASTGQTLGSKCRRGGTWISCCFPKLHRYSAPASRSKAATLVTPRTLGCDPVFSSTERDLCEAANGVTSEVQKNGAPYRIVYVGVGGPVMTRSFTLFSRALSRLRMRSGSLFEGIRIELFGTMLGWQPGEARCLADIAANVESAIWFGKSRADCLTGVLLNCFLRATVRLFSVSRTPGTCHQSCSVMHFLASRCSPHSIGKVPHSNVSEHSGSRACSLDRTGR